MRQPHERAGGGVIYLQHDQTLIALLLPDTIALLLWVKKNKMKESGVRENVYDQ